MLAVTAVKTRGADREAVTDVLMGSCQRLCVHRAMHLDGDSDGPKNAHRKPVSMVDAARCMLDVISCRADDVSVLQKTRMSHFWDTLHITPYP